MDFTGSQTVKAPRAQVFNALLSAEAIKNSIPGAESAEDVNYPTGRQIKLTIAISLPVLSGSHTIFLEFGEIIPNSRVTLITEPSNSHGKVKAVCTIDLTDAPDGTLLSYSAHADREGAISAIPELIVKGAVKTALDTFFKNFEKQALAINA